MSQVLNRTKTFVDESKPLLDLIDQICRVDFDQLEYKLIKITEFKAGGRNITRQSIKEGKALKLQLVEALQAQVLDHLLKITEA